MSSQYVMRTVPAVRIIGRRAVIDPATTGEVIGPLFDGVEATLRQHEVALGTPVATYAQTEGGLAVVVGFVGDGPAPTGTEVIDLPEVTAVCGVHLGEMHGIRDSRHALHRWVGEQGLHPAGPVREVYVRSETPDQAEWITELQHPVTP